MRANATSFTSFLCCIAAAIESPAQANPTLSATQLINAKSTAPALSADVLLGASAYTRQRPTTQKRWTPAPVASRSVPTFWSFSPNRNTAIAQAPIPRRPSIDPATALPRFTSQAPAPNAAALTPATKPIDPAQNELNIAILEQLADYATAENISEAIQQENVEDVVVAQSLPSLETIQQIQKELRELDIPTSVRPRRTVSPGITISNPSGYGADRGQIFAGIGFQSRTRFSGGANPGTIFGGGRRDGTAGIGFGIGDARESVGLQVSYTAASFGGSRGIFSGGLNAKVHKQFGKGWAAAIGGEGIINFGRLPEDDDQIEFNDFENTYYGVVTKTISLREDFYQPLSRLTLTGGAGSGRFRSVDQIVNGEFGVGIFGSAALQVFPSTSLIAEWTGQDLAAGVSIAPFPNFPIVFTPAIRDISGAGDGDPRFVMGVGVSISDIFSKLGL